MKFFALRLLNAVELWAHFVLLRCPILKTVLLFQVTLIPRKGTPFHQASFKERKRKYVRYGKK